MGGNDRARGQVFFQVAKYVHVAVELFGRLVDGPVIVTRGREGAQIRNVGLDDLAPRGATPPACV